MRDIFFSPAAGSFGFAVTDISRSPRYFSGNPTAAPQSGTNQSYSTAEMAILGGTSSGGSRGPLNTGGSCCQPPILISVFTTLSMVLKLFYGALRMAPAVS